MSPFNGLLKECCGHDGVAWGLHLSFHCPELIEFCGLLGFQWLFLDAEHQPLHHERCRELVRAADLVGMPCMVRVPRIDAVVIEGFLDAGVAGILAPNVTSADQAQTLVAAVKFAPEGRRGAADRSRAANYGLTHHPTDYRRQSNRTTMTAALIESRDGVEALESIMAVPGLDCLALGRNDLGLSLGVDTGMADPQVRACVQDAETRIKACGKAQLTIVADAGEARKARVDGARFIAVSDATLLSGAGSVYLERVIRA